MLVWGWQRVQSSSSPTRAGNAASFVHWYRNVFSHVPATKVREIAAMLKAIHASEDIVAAREKAVRVIDKLRGLRLAKAAELAEAAIEETLTYYAFPEEHWRRIRTTDEMDKDFFAIRRTSLESVLLFDARGTFFRPDCPSSAAARRGGQGRPRLSATVRLGLDRPEHGGMLDRSGLKRPDDWPRPALSGATGIDRRRRLLLSRAGDLVAKSGASAASVAEQPYLCPADLRRPRAPVPLGVVVSIARRSAHSFARPWQRPASPGRAAP